MGIGYIGLGSMGGALAARLQLTHPLIVYDQTPEAVAALVKAGATGAADPAELARGCDTIFMCLPTSAHVRDLLFGGGGMAAHLAPGTMLIDQTTGDPNETRGMAADLASRGVDLIDAPVSGGRAGAEAGTISIMVGASGERFSRAEPILRAISPNIAHAGDVGAGHVVKLVNNLVSMTQRLLSFEAVTLAAKNGVDPAKAVEILVSGGARNAYLERILGPKILQGQLNIGFTLALAHKDVRLACELGQQSEVPMFFGNLARELYQAGIREMGRGNQVDTIGLMFDRLAGTSVIPEDTDLPERG